MRHAKRRRVGPWKGAAFVALIERGAKDQCPVCPKRRLSALGTEELTWPDSDLLLALRYNQWKLVFPMHSVELTSFGGRPCLIKYPFAELSARSELS